MRKNPVDLLFPANLKNQLQEEDIDEKREAHHAELECQRSARQSLQQHDDLLHKTQKNSVLGVNHEDLHQNHDEELDCQRSAPQKGNNSWEKTRKTSKSYTTNGLLDRMPDHINERHDIREFHQLFRCLRHGENRARAAGRRRQLGHFDNLLGNEDVESCEQHHRLVCGLTSESRSGRAPPGSSYRLKSSGWGVGGSRIVLV